MFFIQGRKVVKINRALSIFHGYKRTDSIALSWTDKKLGVNFRIFSSWKSKVYDTEKINNYCYVNKAFSEYKEPTDEQKRRSDRKETRTIW